MRTFLLLSILLLAGQPLLAETSGGSLEGIWSEQAQPESRSVSTSIPALTVAPMCTFDEFKNSTLAQKGGWPGIGPFKAGADNPYDMSDQADNHLRVQVADGKVTGAELSISKEKPANQDFLDLEMGADFLLEAVGARGKKISGLNSQLEKNKQAVLFKSDSQPLSLNAGHYLVSIQRRAGGGPDRFVYSIRVNSRDVNKDVLKQHAEASAAPTPGPGQETGTAPAAVESPGPAAGTAGDARKEEFLNAIKKWQRVKKAAVRDLQIDELGQALAGKALGRQTEAVKWLQNKHWYYDLNPLEVRVDRYQEITPGTKYSVFAQVKESSRLIDQLSGKTLKESNDTYKVNYTIEKVDDRWLITDSAIITAGSPPPAARPPAGKAAGH